MNFYFWVAETTDGAKESGVIIASEPKQAYDEVVSVVNRNFWQKYVITKLERIE